jgi:hypothetical protein
MKLIFFILLFIGVNAGIKNSITVLNGNNTIYISYTDNSRIYKLNSSNNIYNSEVVIGNEFYGDVDGFNGVESYIKNPTSIINTEDNQRLFFVDNYKFIKQVDITGNEIRGEELGTIVKTETINNIYGRTSYNYVVDNNIMYFISPKKIHKINLETFDIQDSINTLDDQSNFIDIAYYSNNIYYCYNYDNTYVLKQSANYHNYDIIEDSEITITNSEITNIKGITFLNNNLIITGDNYIEQSNITTTHASIFRTDSIQYNYTALFDYNSIYGDISTTHIIGRVAATNQLTKDGFHEINIGNVSLIRAIELKNPSTTQILTSRESYPININYLYNNNNIIIHFNKDLQQINILSYIKSSHKPTKLKFILNGSSYNFTDIKNITIDKTNNLYICDFINNSSKIYRAEITSISEYSYNLELLEENQSEVIALNYVNTNSELHYTTTNGYRVYNSNKTIENFTNIRRTNDTDDLNYLNDFVIDNDYEIGYIAFEKRIKWFYV